MRKRKRRPLTASRLIGYSLIALPFIVIFVVAFIGLGPADFLKLLGILMLAGVASRIVADGVELVRK